MNIQDTVMNAWNISYGESGEHSDESGDDECLN